MQVLVLVCLLVPGMVMNVAHAATMTNLHTATVPVADNSETEFNRGLGAAFKIVLVKLTGDSTSARQKGFQALITRAAQYNTVFGYENDAAGGLLLRADFDLPGAGAALRARGLQVWGKERPEIVAWLVVTDAAERTLAPNESNSAIFDALAAQASIRGIPLRRPLPSTATMTLVAAASDDELIGELITAAAPSSAQVVLVGLIQLADATWRGRWQLAIDAQREDWSNNGTLAEPLVIEGVDHAVDVLSRHFLNAVEPSSDSVVQLIVRGINTADDYGRALNYLAGLDAVARADVTRVEGSQVVFALKTHGGPAILAQAIGFGRVLTATPEGPATYTLNPP